MDFGKIFNAAMLPTIILIVLGLIGIGLGFLQNALISIAWGFVGLGLSIIVVAYAGYNATKQFKLDLLSAGVTGLFAALISTIVNLILSAVLIFAGSSQVLSENAEIPAVAFGAIRLGWFFIGAVISLVINTIGGLIFGIIGGFIGQKF